MNPRQQARAVALEAAREHLRELNARAAEPATKPARPARAKPEPEPEPVIYRAGEAHQRRLGRR